MKKHKTSMKKFMKKRKTSMNEFMKQSIEYAQKKTYLDDLFKVYPTTPNDSRKIDDTLWKKIEESYKTKKHKELIKNLLELELFPIKDSYVAYLKGDKNAITRNPKTIKRLASEILEMDLQQLFDKCSQPKETNRQIGPMFKNWIRNTDFGIPLMSLDEFSNISNDGILDGSDKEMQNFAKERLAYTHQKGLDFVARMNGKYIIGEAKFLSDFGGHQNAQFNDAIAVVESNAKAEKIAILDGVLYIEGNNKMYKNITEKYKDLNIMSALLLKNFLYSI